MTVTLTLPFVLPGLNEYINAERRHRYAGAQMKRKSQTAVAAYIKQQLHIKFKKPVHISYAWIERNKRRDPSNIAAFGRKVIEDALVQRGVLPNDGWQYVSGFTDSFAVDAKRPRIEITITDGDKGL